jgi:HK97 family phage portal protein
VTLLRGLLGQRSVENPAQPLTSTALVDVLGGPRSHAGVTVTEEKAMGITAIFRGVSIIAGLGASTPLKTYKSGTRERVSVRILDNPHPEMTPFEFWELAWLYVLLWGNAYMLKQRTVAGQLAELWLLHPRRVKVEVETNAKDPNFGRKVFRVRLANGGEKTYTSKEILHVPGLGYDGLQGLSVIKVMAQSLGIALAADEYAARFYSQDATPGGVIIVDGELSSESWSRLKTQWKALHQGTSKAHELGVLEGGAKWQQIGLDAEDSQLLLTRKFSVSEAARLLGLPPHLLADVEKSTSWGTGIEQQNIGLVVYTLSSWFSRFEQRATRELTGPGIFAEYDVNGLLRGDMKTRFESYFRAAGGPWMSVDEVRAFENLEPIDGGDALLRPVNMAAADAVPDDEEDITDEDPNAT